VLGQRQGLSFAHLCISTKMPIGREARVDLIRSSEFLIFDWYDSKWSPVKC
jgi:hypothetical protein